MLKCSLLSHLGHTWIHELWSSDSTRGIIHMIWQICKHHMLPNLYYFHFFEYRIVKNATAKINRFPLYLLQPSSCLNITRCQLSKLLLSFHGRKSSHFIQTQTIEILDLMSVILVCFTQDKTLPTSKTENALRWRKWDFC